jgi:hypothetical protein
MFTFLKRSLMFQRARWRWLHGRCPRCNRNLYSVFAYYMADYPNCPVCKGETETDVRVWHTYRALRPATSAPVAEVKV